MIKMSKKGIIETATLVGILFAILLLFGLYLMVKNNVIDKNDDIIALGSCGNAGQTGNCMTTSECSSTGGQAFDFGCEDYEGEEEENPYVCCITVLA